MPNPFPSCDWGCVSPRTSEGFRKNVDSNRLFGLYLNEFLAKIMQKPISWPMHTQAYYLVVVNFLPYNWISFLLSLVLSDGSEARSSWVSGGHSGHRLSHRITDRLWQAGPREVPRPRRNPGGQRRWQRLGGTLLRYHTRQPRHNAFPCRPYEMKIPGHLPRARPLSRPV